MLFSVPSGHVMYRAYYMRYATLLGRYTKYAGRSIEVNIISIN